MRPGQLVALLSVISCLGLLAVADSRAEQKAPAARMFLDDADIASSSGIVRTLQQPKKLDRPVITGNGTWEACPYMFGTVIYDSEDKVYKAWYQSYNFADPVPIRTPFVYATSSDGRQWTRPNLGLFDYKGSKQNNIILQNAGFHDAYSPSVVKDPKESDPAKRYKMVFWDYSGPQTEKYGDAGMMVAVSPDGIHWKRLQDKPVLYAQEKEQAVSDVMDLMIDLATGKYVVYTKGWADPFPKNRQIVRSESSDFLHWSTPEVVLRHAFTIKDTESYGMPVFKYEGLYLGLLRMFHRKTDLTIDIQLAASRDGRTWTRVADQATFLPCGPAGAWDDGMIFSTAPVVRGDVLEFFYSGWDDDHGSDTRKSAIGVATLPRERFVAVSAKDGEGELQTKSWKLDQKGLTVNADATGGEIRVALLDASGKPIAGFDIADCDPITTDSLSHPLHWRGQASLSALQGREVALRFQIRGKARLFAVR